MRRKICRKNRHKIRRDVRRKIRFKSGEKSVEKSAQKSVEKSAEKKFPSEVRSTAYLISQCHILSKVKDLFAAGSLEPAICQYGYELTPLH